MIEHTFYINLLDDHDRRYKFLNKGYFRWEAVSREEVPDEVDKRMVSYYNYPRQSHLGRCACFCSHMELYHYIIEMKLNNCLILEDDAVKVKDIPQSYPTDGIVYVGGFLGNQKTWELCKEIVDNIEFKKRYRAIDIMLGNMSINKYFEYPGCFVEEGSTSSIAKKDKKSNQYYRWVSIKS